MPTMQLPPAAQVLGATPPAMPPGMSPAGLPPMRAADPEPIRPSDIPPPLHAAPGFPIAPREWRQSQGLPTLAIGANEERTKRILIGASIAFAVIVLLVLVFASDRQPAATNDPPAKIQMKARPTNATP
jgi:hypothetical protein